MDKMIYRKNPRIPGERYEDAREYMDGKDCYSIKDMFCNEDILHVQYDENTHELLVEVNEERCPFTTKELLDAVLGHEERPVTNTDVNIMVGLAQLMIGYPECADDIRARVAAVAQEFHRFLDAFSEGRMEKKYDIQYTFEKSTTMEDFRSYELQTAGAFRFSYESKVIVDCYKDYVAKNGIPMDLKGQIELVDQADKAVKRLCKGNYTDIVYDFADDGTLQVTSYRKDGIQNFSEDTYMSIDPDGQMDMEVRYTCTLDPSNFLSSYLRTIANAVYDGWTYTDTFDSPELARNAQMAKQLCLVSSVLSYVADNFAPSRAGSPLHITDHETFSYFNIPHSKWDCGYLSQICTDNTIRELLYAAPELAPVMKVEFEKELENALTVKIPNHTKPRRQNEAEEINQEILCALKDLIDEADKVMEDPEYVSTHDQALRILYGEEADALYNGEWEPDEEQIDPQEIDPDEEIDR